MKTKITSFRLRPHVLKEVKLLAVLNDATAGEVIDALVRFKNMGKNINDPELKSLFESMWDTALYNARNQDTGWTGKPVQDDGEQ